MYAYYITQLAGWLAPLSLLDFVMFGDVWCEASILSLFFAWTWSFYGFAKRHAFSGRLAKNVETKFLDQEFYSKCHPTSMEYFTIQPERLGYQLPVALFHHLPAYSQTSVALSSVVGDYPPYSGACIFSVQPWYYIEKAGPMPTEIMDPEEAK